MLTTHSQKELASLASMPKLTINDRSIPWAEVLGCLQLFGKLKPFLHTFVSQYALIDEMNSRNDLEVDSAVLMQEIMNFRLKRNLQDQTEFDRWLASEQLDYASFQQRIVLEMKVDLLRQRIAAPNLHPYFEEHRASFAELKLSCLVAKEEATAQQLRAVATTDNRNFRQLATEYSAADDISVSYFQEQVQRRSLPAAVREQMATAAVGDIAGPVQINDVWSILRIEEIIPAELNEDVQRHIEAKLFGQWLAEKLQAMKVGMTLADAPVEAGNHDDFLFG